MSGIHTERNCSGVRLRERGRGMVAYGVPSQVDGDRPAYPDGWITISTETDASFGFKLVDALTHDHEADDPITHCIRLAWQAPAVFLWLRLYTMITTGLRTAPTDAPDVYSSIMLSIRGAIMGVDAARAKAAREAYGQS